LALPADALEAIANDEPPVAGVIEEEVVPAPDDIERVFLGERQGDRLGQLLLGQGLEKEVGRPADAEAGEGRKGHVPRGGGAHGLEKGLFEGDLPVHGGYYTAILAYLLLLLRVE
jgi:hypothetical protein